MGELNGKLYFLPERYSSMFISSIPTFNIIVRFTLACANAVQFVEAIPFMVLCDWSAPCGVLVRARMTSLSVAPEFWSPNGFSASTETIIQLISDTTLHAIQRQQALRIYRQIK